MLKNNQFSMACDMSSSVRALAYASRGRVYSDLHRYDEALRDYAHAIELDPELLRAYAWLARDFDVSINRGAGRARSTKRKARNDRHWFHYWLWSLERSCGVTRTVKLGTHDWYAAGVRLLLAAQRPEGHWRDPENHELATSFALLFLARKTAGSVTPRDRDVTFTKPERLAPKR